MKTEARKVLVFQHLAVEHPGVFRDLLAEDGIECVTVELDEGDVIPRLEDHAALWVMGGPMDVWEEDQYPWLRAEKDAIRHAVRDLGMPYLGFCLGHQLLAAALGGSVALAGAPEVGILEVERAALDSPFLHGVPARFDALQWHSAEVTRAPGDATVLAASPACRVQAMSVGLRAFSMQFHVEMTACTVPDWHAIPAYRSALERSLGADGAERLRTEAAARLGEFNLLAARLYRNWKAATGFAA